MLHTLSRTLRPSALSSFLRPSRAASSAAMSRHVFAPLGAGGDSGEGMHLKGVIFDMDGTLCLPQNHMFAAMRAAVAIPPGEDILDHIHALPSEAARAAAFDHIQAIERAAMLEQVPQAGLVGLMEFLDRRGVRRAICTRNFDAPVAHLLETHLPPHLLPFDPILTRAFRPPKPSPAGILHIAQTWGIAGPADQKSSPRPLLPLLMVGDSVDDMAAGHDAGCLTVLLRSAGKEELEADGRVDCVVDRLDDLIPLLDGGIRSTR